MGPSSSSSDPPLVDSGPRHVCHTSRRWVRGLDASRMRLDAGPLDESQGERGVGAAVGRLAPGLLEQPGMKTLTRGLGLLFVLPFVACLPDPGDGRLDICLDDEAGGAAVDLELDGVVGAIDGATTQCAQSTRTITFEDGEGVTHTLGFSVFDADGADITPALDLAPGATISVLYRYRLVFGSTAGVVVSDGEGLVAALEQGGWGGALQAGDVPGLDVSVGSEIVAEERTACEPKQGRELIFAADETVTLTPVASTDLTVDGTPATALALAAYEYSDGGSCSVEDNTGFTTWAVYRPKATH
jgi:hypothetical protein